MTFIRFILGKIILGLDAAFVPKGLARPLADQLKIDHELKDWRLYQLQTCPFCVKVRREMKRLSITIPLLDIKKIPEAYEELMQGGKIDQYPCLMIPNAQGEKKWMYESSEIIEFLKNRFSQ
jgi:glutaredoxin